MRNITQKIILLSHQAGAYFDKIPPGAFFLCWICVQWFFDYLFCRGHADYFLTDEYLFIDVIDTKFILSC